MSENSDSSAEVFRRNFEERIPHLEKLEKIVLDLLQNGLVESGIKTLPIQHRIKEVESAVQKFQRKNYTHPLNEMTDCLGVRIIAFLNSDLSTIEEKVREIFSVDERNSINKREIQEVNQVGYRSSHIVATLGEQRQNLPEYRNLCTLPFEIQIRTILEHAWSEIEHGQQYKAVQALPKPLQRRLNIVSGNLELLDRELSQIAHETRQYMEDIENREDDISNDAISASSIIAICLAFGKTHAIKIEEAHDDDYDLLIEELNKFGIKSVIELRELIEAVPIQRYPRNLDYDHIPIFGLVRTAMAMRNPKLTSELLGSKGINMPDSIFSFMENEGVQGLEFFRDVKKG